MVIANVAVVVGLVLAAGAVIVPIAVWGWMVRARRQDKREAEDEAIRAGGAEEERAAEELVHWLSGRRVLWNSKVEEIPQEAVESVGAIRSRVEASFGSLRNPRARSELETIRRACVELLDKPREGFQASFSEEAWCALERLRSKARPSISRLSKIYDLEVPEWRDYRGGFEDEGIPIYIPPPES